MGRFVILTMVRTGSYMVASALNSHRQVTCFGELVKKNPLNDLDYLDFAEEYPNATFYIENRLKDPIEFIDRVLSFGEKRSSCCGFKLMIPQNPAALDYVCIRKEYKKILLFRQNILAAYSSNLIARTTKQGVALPGDKVHSAKVRFDPAAFDTFLKRRLHFFQNVREKLKDEIHMDIEYTEACTDAGIGRVLDFISVDPSETCRPRTLKRNRGPIIDRFENRREVEVHMKSIGQEDWLSEG